MTALRAPRRGGPEVLVVERAPVPVAAGEVVVRYSRTPVIPSHEVSGLVSDIASGVRDFAPGDEVYGLIRFDRDGAAADFVAVPAADLATKPSTVSHVVAAALRPAGLTALQALVGASRGRPCRP